MKLRLMIVKLQRVFADLHAQTAGGRVPAACPQEILNRLLCTTQHVRNSLRESGRDTLLNMYKRSVFQVPPVEFPFRKPPTNVYEMAGDGAPFMVFACAHPGAETLVFGANEPNWKGLPEVAAVLSRQIRDTRLSAYILYAHPAFKSLKEKERLFTGELQSNHDAHSSNTKSLVYDARKRAIRLMRDDSSFLGGTHEMGLAVRTPEWSTNQPCYLCQGMMGYEVVKQWKGKEVKKYLLQFNWELRGDYPHSCAEAVART